MALSAVLSLNATDDELHIKKFLGSAEIPGENLCERNRYYWSVGTTSQDTGRIFSAFQVLSGGGAQADYRICTYEDGSPIFEDGKYFFNISSRMAGVGQTVYSYDINTCRFTLTGVLQGYKEGKPFECVAPHIMYNRKDGMWYVFAHWEDPHMLCFGKCYRDPRYGYNEVHASLLDYSGRTKGDEDNFIYYDSDRKKWVLVYSKGADTMAKQESRHIDRGYRMVCSQDSVKTLTGINVVKVGGKRYIVTGSMWTPQTDAYKVFDADDLSYMYNLDLDIPTGGFRGWGTLIGVTEGEETKYQILTFDRSNPNPVNRWQYGNMYLYEAQERNPGTEYDLVRPDGKVIGSNAEQVFSPKDLHFRRKFSQRMNYSQELQTGKIDLSCRIFLKNGNLYPVKDKTGEISFSQEGNSILVKGKGSLSLFGGTHLPNCEYIIDLHDLAPRERRYLKIGTMEKDAACIGFAKDGDSITVSVSDKEVLRISASITRIRVILKEGKAYFIDAVI